MIIVLNEKKDSAEKLRGDGNK